MVATSLTETKFGSKREHLIKERAAYLGIPQFGRDVRRFSGTNSVYVMDPVKSPGSLPLCDNMMGLHHDRMTHEKTEKGLQEAHVSKNAETALVRG